MSFIMKNGYEYIIDFLKKEGIEYKEENELIYFTYNSNVFTVLKGEDEISVISLVIRPSFDLQDLIYTCDLLNNYRDKNYYASKKYSIVGRNVFCHYFIKECSSSDEIYPILCKLDENRQVFLSELMKKNIPSTNDVAALDNIPQIDVKENNMKSIIVREFKWFITLIYRYLIFWIIGWVLLCVLYWITIAIYKCL